MKRIVIDLDGTIAGPKHEDYIDCIPDNDVIQRMESYRDAGFEIIVYTARNMRTYEQNIGKINVHTIPVVLEWLNRHSVPYDEVIVGKPWCGVDGFYVDDRAIRPDEFKNLSQDEIVTLLGLGDSQD